LKLELIQDCARRGGDGRTKKFRGISWEIQSATRDNGRVALASWRRWNAIALLGPRIRPSYLGARSTFRC